jgi:uncharacterized protein (DUF362 family)
MITSRREFLNRSAAFITALPVFYSNVFARQYDIDKSKEYFDPGIKRVRDGLEFSRKHERNNVPPVLREEILDNHEAVFIIKTNVMSSKDEDGRFPPENEKFAYWGYRTAHAIFCKGTERGGTTYIKPNFVGGFDADPRSVNNGISTHPAFVAGFCDALKELSNENIVVGANGAASHRNFVESGICEMLHERGVCFTEGKYKSYKDYSKSEITWVDYPEGVVMRRIPFFRLVKEKDTTFINMAKDRIHNLGITTLTIKNIQGIMPVGYMHVCGGWGTELNRGTEKNVFNPNYRREIERFYIKHAQEGFKYWDEYDFAKTYFDAGGWEAFQKKEFMPDYKIFWFEQWAQRMLDIDSNIHPCINLVEGIVGVDGADVLHLNNFITISRSMVSCDSVASWMMGHDPRELFYLRIAKERRMGENDIGKLAIYEITDRGIKKVSDYRMLPRARMGVNLFNIGKELRFI